MVRLRWIAAVSAVALAAGTAAATVSGVAGASRPWGRTSTQSAVCPAVPAGYSTCLVHVLHARGSEPQATAAPSGLSPKAIATAYGFATTGGTGTTIAIVDAYGDPTITKDLTAFSSEYSLPACTTANGCFSKVMETGGTTLPASTSGWVLETSLDVEWAHALAPKAHLVLVEAVNNDDSNLFASVEKAAARAKYVSMSWGGTEFADEADDNSVFTGTGVSFFAAAGDTASDVLFPAASPNVVAVGGTTLTVTASSDKWKSETAWDTAGGGCSKYEQAAVAQAAYPTYDQANATCEGMRAIPDISLDANPTSGVAVYDTDGYSGWVQVGGTSASTVMVASHAAETGKLVNATYVYGSSIKAYDVTSGSNGHPCESGYDLCTGIGSWNTAVGTTRSSGTLRFTPAAQTLTAGKASGAMTIALSSAAPSSGATISLSTSSSTGGFSTSETGPFSASLSVTAAAAATKSATFYYEDTKAGSPTLTASASGWTSGTQAETVGAGALTRLAVSPTSASLSEGGSQAFTASGYDAYTNAVTVDPAWSVSGVSGSFSASSGASTTFTAGTTAGKGTVTATVTEGSTTVKGTASVTVASTPALAVSVTAGTATKSGSTYRTTLTVDVSASSKALKGATVALKVYSGSCTGTLDASGSGTTGAKGTVAFTFSTSTTGTYCAKATASDSGYSPGTASTTFTVSATAGVRARRGASHFSLAGAVR